MQMKTAMIYPSLTLEMHTMQWAAAVEALRFHILCKARMQILMAHFSWKTA